MNPPKIIHLDIYDEDRTWEQNRIDDDDIVYIRADIVQSEIRCTHLDMNPDKRNYSMTADGAKRLVKILEGEK